MQSWILREKTQRRLEECLSRLPKLSPSQKGFTENTLFSQQQKCNSPHTMCLPREAHWRWARTFSRKLFLAQSQTQTTDTSLEGRQEIPASYQNQLKLDHSLMHI